MTQPAVEAGKVNPPPAERLRKQQALERIRKLYEAWDAAEPETGKAEKAAQWRTKLQRLGAPAEQPPDAAPGDDGPR